MEEFVNEHGLTSFEHIADPGASIWRAFEITAQPSFVFINDDGTIVRHVGGLPTDQLAEELDALAAT